MRGENRFGINIMRGGKDGLAFPCSYESSQFSSYDVFTMFPKHTNRNPWYKGGIIHCS